MIDSRYFDLLVNFTKAKQDLDTVISDFSFDAFLKLLETYENETEENQNTHYEVVSRINFVVQEVGALCGLVTLLNDVKQLNVVKTESKGDNK